MFYLECYDQYGDPITRMTQWDLNQKIYIKEHNFTNAPLFHYCNKNTEKALVVQSTLSDNTLVVDVPNQLLVEPYPITAYVYLSENETGKTVTVINIPINQRPKPNDFEYKDNVEIVKLTDLANEIKELNAQIAAEEEVRISQENARVEAENIRVTTETQRVQNESQRNTNESTRESNENARINNEDTRKTAENNRVTAENNRVTAENERDTAEIARDEAETTRNSNENTRKSNENVRNIAESEREAAETDRKSAEENRVSAETERNESEINRKNAESTRVSNENARVEAESARDDAETLRQSNEETRKSNETTRETSETERKQSETVREANESTRKTNETTRVNSEATRNSNENERKSAEATRKINENTRIENENTRISAENTRVTNESTRQSQEETRQTNTAAAITNAETATTRANNAAKACEDIVAGTGFISSTEKGVANGIATLDTDGKVPLTQLPNIESGARNLIPYPYYETTLTRNGITFTDNGDGTVTLNGTATAKSYYTLNSSTSEATILLRKGTYVIGGATDEALWETYNIRVYTPGDSGSTLLAWTYGKSKSFTLTEDTYVWVQIGVYSGVTIDNITLYPMLELGSVAHDFVPYHFGGAEDALKANQASKLRAFNGSGADYGTDDYLLRVQMGAIGNDNNFGLVVGDGTYGVKVNDADTVDGYHAGDLVKQHGSFLTSEQMNDSNWRDNYEGVTTDGTLVGLQSGWWYIKYFNNINADGYGAQIAIPLDGAQGYTPKYRLSVRTVWNDWKNFGDGVFLPLTGGTITQTDGVTETNVAITNSAALEARLKFKNSVKEGTILSRSDGYFGMWDITNVKNIIGTTLDGTMIIDGNNKPLHTGNSAKVATSGSYNDLTDKPTIPTVGNGTITIKQAGATKGTFTTNQSGNTTIELADNNTTYGVATSSELGLVKSGTDITVDSSGNVSVKDDSHNHVISNVDGLQAALDGKQANLGFTPVQQGGGTNQFNNKVYIGWTGITLDVTVDGTDMGSILMSGTGKSAVLPVNRGGTGANDAATARSNLGVAYGTAAGTVCQGNDSRLSNARTPVAHNQAASTITAGTLAGKVLANASAVATLGNKQVRNIYAGTADMTAGETALPTGDIYIVYE